MAIAKRRKSVGVLVGGVKVGGDSPIVVQSMTNTDTEDAVSTSRQVAALAAAGSELVRITVNTRAAAKAVPEIMSRLHDQGIDVPVIGDFHYNGHILLTEVRPNAPARSRNTGSTPVTSGPDATTTRTSGA